MWYVVQVVGGRETSVVRKVQRLVDPSTYNECFVAKREVRKKYHGAWQLRQEVLFPGYVFVDTKTPERFQVELAKVPAMTKLLAGGDAEGEQGKRFAPLSDDEQALIAAFIGDKTHVMRMSEGVIEGDETVILKGPLMDHIGLVKKIDRHKRLAYLDIPLLGRTVNVKVGLEIIRKS